jgi:hypothetical protein
MESKQKEIKSTEIFNQFKELKGKMQDKALSKHDMELFKNLSAIGDLFLSYGFEYAKEGLNKGIEITKEIYNK